MKIIFSISITIIFIQLGFSQPIFETSYKNTIIQQKIKSQTNLDYNYINNKPSPKGIKTSYTKYNSNGDVVEFVTYKLKDTLTFEEYSYDNSGNRIYYIKHKGGKKNIAYQKISKYNNSGDLILENGFNGSEKFKNTYKYDANGKLSEIHYYIDNQLNEKRYFNQNDNITNVEVYNSSGIATSYITLKYNGNGNLSEEILLDANKKPMEKKLLVYNNQSKIISEVKYRLDKFYYKLTYLYNKMGGLINIEEENLNAGRFSKKKFKYDNNGKLIEMKWRRKSNEEFNQRNYTYNGKGICTEVITNYPSTKFKVLTKYEYEYY